MRSITHGPVREQSDNLLSASYKYNWECTVASRLIDPSKVQNSHSTRTKSTLIDPISIIRSRRGVGRPMHPNTIIIPPTFVFHKLPPVSRIPELTFVVQSYMRWRSVCNSYSTSENPPGQPSQQIVWTRRHLRGAGCS